MFFIYNIVIQGAAEKLTFFEKRAKRQGVKVGSWEGVRPKG